MSNVIVSIFMLTYNQEEFISQAIEGVLMQKTDFVYQLVIGEDCSADNTRKICEEYAAANPEKIKLLSSYKNLGLINNFIRTYKECNGKYVAICDGDDFWTDPFKLQKQVDFLENNQDYSLVFTSFNFLFPDGRIVEKDYEGQAGTTNFRELIFENYISSVTAVFRNKKHATDFPSWLDRCPYGDWPLYLWTTRDGSKIKFLNQKTAVYRREIGVSEKMKLEPSRIALENLKIVDHINKDSHFERFSIEFSKSLVEHRKNLLACYLNEGKLKEALNLSRRLMTSSPVVTLRVYFFFLKKKYLRPLIN